jgi:hypothetical protein
MSSGSIAHRTIIGVAVTGVAVACIAVLSILPSAVQAAGVAPELTEGYCKAHFKAGSPEYFQCTAEVKKCQLNPDYNPKASAAAGGAECPKRVIPPGDVKPQA